MRELRHDQNQARVCLLIGVILSLLVVAAKIGTNFLGWTGRKDLLTRLDERSNDWYGQIENASGPSQGELSAARSIVILYVTEEAINDPDRLNGFPFPRAHFARLVRVLSRAGAKVVVLDFMFYDQSRFNRPGTRSDDESLEKAANASTNVSLAASYSLEAGAGLVRILPTLPGVKDLDGKVGFVDQKEDPDRVFRKIDLYAFAPWKRESPHFPSLELDALCKYLGLSRSQLAWNREGKRLSLGSREIPLENHRLRIRYLYPRDDRQYFAIDRETYNYMDPSIPEDELVKSLLDDGRFTGKIVLVGLGGGQVGSSTRVQTMSQMADLGSERDIKLTPFGLMPGAEVHAQALHTILAGRFLRAAPDLFVFAVILLYGFFLGFAFPRASPLLAFLGIVWLVCAHMTMAFAAYRYLGYCSGVAWPLLGLVLCYLSEFTYLSFVTYKEKKLVQNLFEGYLSPEVVASLKDEKVRRELQLSGKREKVTIFYSDIRGFTTLSERETPEAVFNLLNEYFQVMSDVARKYRPYMDKFIGDCIMAVFSIPQVRPDDARLAVLMAIEMQEEIDRLQERWAIEGKPTFTVGMGINTGEVIAGIVGSDYKKDYTVIGDNVNLAARLYTQARGRQILVSESTNSEIQDLIQTIPLEPIYVKGKEERIQVFEVVGVREAWKGGIQQLREEYLKRLK
ncbi:MAG: adenylate/guanylate cyclase domain-containing protein [Armatimonadetes bacterium]|nr:adenylate/guanylate cyclase domain-containing protein [Armatimonadota bacterium]